MSTSSLQNFPASMAWVPGSDTDHQQKDQSQTLGDRGLSGVMLGDGDCEQLVGGMEKKENAGVVSANKKNGQELELKGTRCQLNVN